MFAVPALVAAAACTGVLFAIVIAVLWAFVLGDNTWPGFVVPAVVGAAVLCFLGVAAVFLSLAHTAGAAEEARPTLNRTHVALSAVATALSLLLLVAVYLARDFGATGPEARCSRLCRDRGFQISKPSPPESGPRSCICLDSNAREALTIPLPEAAPKP
ncbi:MAG TPA: hypothetical protein VFI80_01830 [Burkholderiales bacterium]|nr:hypothetical protein [Burkholderiales bacterium]